MKSPYDRDPFESIIHRFSSSDEKQSDAAPAQAENASEEPRSKKGGLDAIISQYSSGSEAPDKGADQSDRPSAKGPQSRHERGRAENEKDARRPPEVSRRARQSPSLSPGDHGLPKAPADNSPPPANTTVWKASRNGTKNHTCFVASYILQEDPSRELIDDAECGVHCPGGGICCEVEQYRGKFGFSADVMDLVTPGSADVIRECECSRDCPGYGRCCEPDDRMLSSAERKLLKPRSVTMGDLERWRAALAEGAKPKRREIEEALICLSQTRLDEAIGLIEEYAPRANPRLKGLANRAFLEWYLNAEPPNPSRRDRLMEDDVARDLEREINEAQRKVADKTRELRALECRWELAKRLLAKAESEDEKERWEVQCSVFSDLHCLLAADIEDLEDEIGVSGLMLSELKKPSRNECVLS